MKKNVIFAGLKNTKAMNRDIYVSRIRTLLSVLKTEIKESGKLNLLDINVHSEDFFRDLLNLIYGWQLQNMNQWNQNAAGGDLWYDGGKLVVQVSSTSTKQKIQSSIEKLNVNQFDGYRFKFLRIDGDVRKLCKETYNTLDGISFDPASDIIDYSKLLKDITHLDIDIQKAVCELCVKEIVPTGMPQITETDLAVVVRTLASNFRDWEKHRRPIKFDVEKKISFNNLGKRRRLILDYTLYNGKLSSVYQEFFDNGTDCRSIILQNLSDMYSRYMETYESEVLFDKIIEETRDFVSNSAIDVPNDRLNVCVNVVVVDAFICCRIFEDPEGYNDVDA